MSNKLTREYINVLRERYKKGNKAEKTYLLNIICEQTNAHRKSAIRLMAGNPKVNRRSSPSGINKIII